MSERWLSVSEAAGELGCNKSSISRFLAKNPDVAVRRNAAGQVVSVDYTALVMARSGSLAVQDHADRAAAPSAPARAAPPQALATAPVGSRRREIQDELAEIDLAERKGQLISRTAAFAAIEAAGVALVQALEQRRRPLAQRLAGLNDVRTLETELKTADRALQAKLADALRSVSLVDEGEEAPQDAAAA